MEFLKRHYEKITLSVFVLILLAASFYFLRQLREVRDQFMTGMLDRPTHEVTLERYENERFNALKNLRQPDVAWSIDNKQEGSLFNPGQLIWCVNPECNYWLPYNTETCFHCGAPQGKIVIKGKDSDNDGIADEDEGRYDFLNPADPRDAKQDHDQDWFTNVEEIRAGTDPGNQEDHPPLTERLHLWSVQRQRLDIIFSNLMKYENRGKDEWDIVLQVVEQGQRRTRFVNIGETVANYKVVDVRVKEQRVYSKSLKDYVTVDVSEVVLESGDGDAIVLKRQQPSYRGVLVQFFLNTDPHNRREGKFYNVSGEEDLVLTDAAGQEEVYAFQVRDTETVAIRPKAQPDAPIKLLQRWRPPRQPRFEERAFRPEEPMPMPPEWRE
ncbi:MAG: hypothetical protein K9N51_11130 [Candidatus Pacebacteria bacterium]|nr:hypothetical protein [Candidatus Paceibacterota bacterium]